MYLGIDIGGSKTLIARFDSKLNIIEQQQLQTPDKPETLLDSIAKVALSMNQDDHIEAIGLAAPGIVNDGVLTNKTTLNWENVPIQSMVQNKLKAPTIAYNDASLAGLYEARLGAGAGCRKVLYLTISTGVGSSLIIDGNLTDSLGSSEAGYMIVGNSDGDYCDLESLVSGPAFKKRFLESAHTNQDPEAWNKYAHDLAIGIYNAVAITTPDVVVIGGGMANHYELFNEPLEQYLGKLDNKDMFSLPKIVKKADEIELAVIYGCAIIASEVAK